MLSFILISSNERMKLPLFFRRIFFFVSFAIYTLAFGELFVRFANPQVLFPRYVSGTPWGVRGNIPNAHYWHTSPEVKVEFKINNQGMRAARDYAFVKPAGTCRIALFGDSFFMGYELNLKDTFAARLEERLRADHFNVEVLNFSVSGFGTAEMVRAYAGFGFRYDPDVVIFQWHSTDLDDNVRSNLFALKNGLLEGTGESYLPGIKIQDALMKLNTYRLVADNSHLYSLVRERTSNFIQRLLVKVTHNHNGAADKVQSRSAESQSDQMDIPYTMLLSAALFQHARQEILNEGRDFFVVDIPDRITRTSFRSSIGVIQNLVSDLNVISPLAAFDHLSSADTKLYYERGHFHLTPLAIDALVGVVSPSLEQSTKLQDCWTDQ